MRNLWINLFIFLCITSFAFSQSESNNWQFDLSSGEDNVKAFVKFRTDLSGKEVVYYWTGKVYAFLPGEPDKLLFKFAGFNVARAVQIENGYRILTREAAFYLHPETGEILENWENSFTGERVEVLHVWNDPVNMTIPFESKYGPTIFSTTDLGDDRLVWNMDIFLAYPSPLKREDYPANSQNDLYEATELFQFFTHPSEIADGSRTSASAMISWIRVSPWQPFMRLGDKPGNLFPLSWCKAGRWFRRSAGICQKLCSEE